MPNQNSHLLRARIDPTTGAMVRWQMQPRGGPVLPEVISGGGGPYHYHQGDIFTPGAQNYVFEPIWEQPIYTLAGGGGTAQGVYRGANSFNIRQPPQVWQAQAATIQGLGGLQAGQIFWTPLAGNGVNEGML